MKTDYNCTRILKCCYIRKKPFCLFLVTLFIAFSAGCKKQDAGEILGQEQELSLSLPIGREILVPNPGDNTDIQPLIQAAVNNAVNGDIIVIPAGKFIFSKTITINKLISIKGAGMNYTTLYRSESISDATLASWGSFFTFNINSTTSSNIVISDIYLKGQIACTATGDGGSLAADYGIKLVNCVDFKIVRCRFKYFGYAALSIQHDDNIARGIVYKSEFLENVKGPDGLGLGYGILIYGANKQWISSPGFGTNNFVFVEDNFFDWHRHAIAAAGCALYVFRFNTVKNNMIAQAIDAHEGRQTSGSNYYSTRAVEIYNNTVTNAYFKDWSLIAAGQSAQMLSNNCILIRGGEALIHNNYIRGYRFGVGLINFEVSGTQSYPIHTQPGYASGLTYGKNHTGTKGARGNGDLFSWNNDFSPYAGSYSSSVFYNFQPEYFKQNRDYHLVAKPNYVPYTYPHPGRI